MDLSVNQFKNIDWNKENVWLGDAVFKFYHSQKCPHCGYAGRGFNDLDSEGPWDFNCYGCGRDWSVVMDGRAKAERRKLLLALHKIDDLIGEAKAIRGFKQR